MPLHRPSHPGPAAPAPRTGGRRAGRRLGRGRTAARGPRAPSFPRSRCTATACGTASPRSAGRPARPTSAASAGCGGCRARWEGGPRVGCGAGGWERLVLPASSTRHQAVNQPPFPPNLAQLDQPEACSRGRGRPRWRRQPRRALKDHSAALPHSPRRASVRRPMKGAWRRSRAALRLQTGGKVGAAEGAHLPVSPL